MSGCLMCSFIVMQCKCNHLLNGLRQEEVGNSIPAPEGSLFNMSAAPIRQRVCCHLHMEPSETPPISRFLLYPMLFLWSFLFHRLVKIYLQVQLHWGLVRACNKIQDAGHSSFFNSRPNSLGNVFGAANSRTRRKLGPSLV